VPAGFQFSVQVGEGFVIRRSVLFSKVCSASNFHCGSAADFEEQKGQKHANEQQA